MAGTGARRTTPVDADSGSWMVRILGDLELVENARVGPNIDNVGARIVQPCY